MLSIATRSLKSTGFKPAVRCLAAVRTKVTLPELPYEYDVSSLYTRLWSIILIALRV